MSHRFSSDPVNNPVENNATEIGGSSSEARLRPSSIGHTTTAERRNFLKMAAAVPAAGVVGSSALMQSNAAIAAMDTPANALKHTGTVGNFEVSTLLAGSRVVENPQNIFGMNVSADEFNKASEANFLPSDKTRFYFNPSVVRAGDEIVLFDTGLNQAGILGALEQAGLTADDITTVVITHMHGDHIGGLIGEDGTPTFAKARHVTGQQEFDAWAKMGNERFDGVVKPLADQFDFIGDGDAIISGITAMAAFGHTPGHMIYRLESEGKQLVITADTANH